jgi:alkylhydroperoxidase family enzyme
MARIPVGSEDQALLSYARKVTETPSLVDSGDTEKLRSAGWDDQAIWEITALIFF